jgi:hypothetical protein
MDTTTNKMADVPTLDEFYERHQENFDFLSDDMKQRFIVGAIRRSVISGNDDILGTSPRAKKMKNIVQLWHDYLPEDDQKCWSSKNYFRW